MSSIKVSIKRVLLKACFSVKKTTILPERSNLDSPVIKKMTNKNVVSRCLNSQTSSLTFSVFVTIDNFYFWKVYSIE